MISKLIILLLTPIVFIANKPIKKGDILGKDNLSLLRSSTGIPAKYWDFVAGKVAKRDYEEDEPIDL